MTAPLTAAQDAAGRLPSSAKSPDPVLTKNNLSVYRQGLELLLLACFVGLISWQIFVPPFIGLADNGDFPKVTGRLSIGPKGPYEKFNYFTSDYVHSPRYHWKGKVILSEVAPAWLATSLVRNVTRSDSFDIRYLGAVHLALLALAYYLLLTLLRGFHLAVTLGVSGLALFIFTDAAYISYLNSFYSDVTAFLGLLLMVGSALHIMLDARPGWKMWSIFVFSALLFITSKGQHGMWGGFAALFVWYAATRPASRIPHKPAIGLCVVLLAVTTAEFFITPREYKAQALFNLVFFKLLKDSPRPAEDLRQLNLESTDAQYVGLTAYSTGSPAKDPNWLRAFYKRVGYKSVARFYLSHPLRMLSILRGDLYFAALLQTGFGNYRREDGFPPRTQARRFTAWSRWRSDLFMRYPVSVLLWYIAVAAGCLWYMFRAARPISRAGAIICLGLAFLAALEYSFASLAEAVETHRHLFIFQTLTDVTVCFAAAALLSLTEQLRPPKSGSEGAC